MSQVTLEVIKSKMTGELITIQVENVMYFDLPDEMVGSLKALVHMLDGSVYICQDRLNIVEQQVGEGFIRLSRRCIVSVKAIHSISDFVYLNNGEKLRYSPRKKKVITGLIHEKQKKLLEKILAKSKPMTMEEYQEHYKSFDFLPVAFTDIEMVFDENANAVDWIFCYGNEALAKLEKTPLEEMIGKSFGALFANMDPKWLKSYEQATLYGKILDILDYSPEIDTYLHVTCFPTFPGHCGCILRNIKEMEFAKGEQSTETALRLYLANIVNA